MSARIPWTLVVLAAAFLVPLLGSRYYTFLATDIAIWALFAMSLNLLLGYSGLVSFGHAAYFGIGAYTTGLLMKKPACPSSSLSRRRDSRRRSPPWCSASSACG